MISLTIDGVAVAIQQNTEYVEDATEEFDFGTGLIINNSQRAPYPDFADIVLTIDEYEIQTCLQKDTVSRIAPDLYQHQLVFTEYAAKLAMFQHPDRKFDTVDGDKTTYRYHLETILGTLDGYVGKTAPLTVAAATLTMLEATADEKEYNGGNLLITLSDMFRYVNAVPTLSSTGVIGHKMLNEYGDLVSFSRIEGEVIESDISDYGYRVTSKVKNATYEADLNTSGTWYPSQDAGVTVRSLSEKYDDTNAVFLLDTPIRRLIVAYGMNITTDSDGTYTDLIIPIVSKEEWDNLKLNRVYAGGAAGTNVYEGKYKNNTLYFDDNVIYNVGTEYEYSGITAGLPKDGLNQAIRRAIYLRNGSTSQYTAQTLSNVELQFYYQPIRDLTVSQVRADYNRVTRNATVLNTQKDSTLELRRMGQANKSFINRIGNDTYTVTVRYFDGDTPFEVFDYLSTGYKIIKRQFVVRGTTYDVKYTLTKNQSNLNPITGVKYESVSPFTITKKSTLTNYLYEEYYEFSDTDKTDTATDDADARKILLNSLAYGSSYDKPIWHATYRRGTSDYIGMSAIGIPMGNSFQFNVQFRHPKFAGLQLNSDTIGKKVEPLSYTDEFGQAGAVRVRFGYKPAAVNEDTYPVTTDWPTYYIQSPIFDADLQPNEIFALTVVKHVISDVDGLIIGDYFLENNNLIKQLSLAQNIAVGYYDTNPRYTIYDQHVKGTPDGAGTLTLDIIDYSYFDIGGVTAKSWVVYNNDATSDDYQRIYFAFNYTGTSLTRVYINALKDDPNINSL